MNAFPEQRLSFEGNRLFKSPSISIETALRFLRIFLESFFEQTNNRRFGTSDRTVQKKNAMFGSKSFCGGFESGDKFHEWNIKSKNGISSLILRVIKKFVVNDMLFCVYIFVNSRGEYHIVKPLKGISGNLR